MQSAYEKAVCLPSVRGNEPASVHVHACVLRPAVCLVFITVSLLLFLWPNRWAVAAERHLDLQKSNLVNTIFLLDVSESMVDDILNAARFDANRPLSQSAIRAFLRKPENQTVLSNNILYRNVKMAEMIVEDYEAGHITVIPFGPGFCDLDGNGPLPKKIEFTIDGPSAAEKARLKHFLNPAREGAFSEAPRWEGLLHAALFRRIQASEIDQSCLEALTILENSLHQPSSDPTFRQQLVVFTDGEGPDRLNRLTEVLARCQKLRNRCWFEFREVYLGNRAKLKPATLRAHEKIREAGFIVDYGPMLTRRLRVSANETGLFSYVNEADLIKGSNKFKVVLQPLFSLLVESDDNKPVDGDVDLHLAESKSPSGVTVRLLTTNLNVREALTTSPLALEIEATSPGLRTLITPTELRFGLIWEFSANRKPGSVILHRSSSPTIPVKLSVRPKPQLVRISLTNCPTTDTEGWASGNLFEQNDSANECIANFVFDFRDAEKLDAITLEPTIFPPEAVVFDGQSGNHLTVRRSHEGASVTVFAGPGRLDRSRSQTVTVAFSNHSERFSVSPNRFLVSIPPQHVDVAATYVNSAEGHVATDDSAPPDPPDAAGRIRNLIAELQNNPGDVRKRLLLAAEYELRSSPNSRDLDHAFREYQQVLRYEAKNPDALFGLARLHYALGELADAERTVARALEFSTNRTPLLVLWAEILRSLDRYDAALQAARQAVALDSKCARAYYVLGSLFDSRNPNPDKAIDYYSKAIEIDPKMSESYFFRALQYDVKGLAVEAGADFRTVIQLDAQSRWSNLSKVYLERIGP